MSAPQACTGYLTTPQRTALLLLGESFATPTDLGVSGMTMKALHRYGLLNAESDGYEITYWMNRNGLAVLAILDAQP